MTEAVAVKSGTVRFTLDGQPVEAPGGTTILEAARSRGVYIPTLCYLEKLLPIGSCRICSVEVEGVNGPVMSCATPVLEDMAVTTKSDSLAEYRRQMMQFILVNHPVDCPICERSGECSLQDRSFEFNASWQAFKTEDYKKKPVIDWAALRYDKNLCIMCERCVKICREVQGFNALEIDGSGYGAKINTVTRQKLDCDFCGQCLSVCPVGAISSAIILSARSWEIKKVESICPHCGVGCSYHMDLKLGKIVRISSDDNIGVNNGNLCVRGRFGFEAFHSDERIKTPLALKGVKHEPVSWDQALSEVVEKIKETKQKHGPNSVAVLASENLTNEDAYMLQKVMRAGFGVNHIDTMSNMINSDLNAQMFDNYGASSQITSYDEIGKAGAFLFFGCDAANENPVIANMVRMAMRDKGAPLFVASSRDTSDFFPGPDSMMRYKYGTEAYLAASLIKAVTDADIGGLDPDSVADQVDDTAGLVKSAEFINVQDAAKVTGVDFKAIKQTATALALRGAPLIFIGKEIHDHHGSAEIMRALANLANLTGGKTLVYKEHCNSQGANDMGLSPTHLPGYLKADDTGAVEHYNKKWGSDFPAFSSPGPNIFDGLSDGTIKTLIVAGCDPITYYPDGQYVREAIQNAEFLVVSGSFPSETSVLANITLPSCQIAEREGTYTNNEGRVQLIRKAIDRVGQARPEWEIFADIGARLGLDSYLSCEQVADEIADSVPGYQGLTHDNVSGGGGLVSYPRKGKAESFQFNIKPVETGESGSYPFLALIMNSLFHLGPATRRSPTLNRLEPSAYIEMNPEDAEEGSFNEGDKVVVESKQGSILASLKIKNRARKGVVFIPINFENAPAAHLVYRNDPVTRVKISKS